MYYINPDVSPNTRRMEWAVIEQSEMIIVKIHDLGVGGAVGVVAM